MKSQTAQDYLNNVTGTAKAALARAQKEANAMARIVRHWPAQFLLNFIHLTNLYGVTGWVSIGDKYSGENTISREQLADLLAALPPVPATLVRDGCVSIQPDYHLANVAKTPKHTPTTRSLGPSATLTPVWGLTLRVQQSECQANWITELAPGIYVQISATFSNPAPITMQVNTRRDNRTGTVLEILGVSYQAKIKTGQRIKYGGGSSTDPGQYMFYWDRTSMPAREQWERISGILEAETPLPTSPLEAMAQTDTASLDQQLANDPTALANQASWNKVLPKRHRN